MEGKGLEGEEKRKLEDYDFRRLEGKNVEKVRELEVMSLEG